MNAHGLDAKRGLLDVGPEGPILAGRCQSRLGIALIRVMSDTILRYTITVYHDERGFVSQSTLTAARIPISTVTDRLSDFFCYWRAPWPCLRTQECCISS